MTLSIDLDWQGYQYFPYEFELARREVLALLGKEPESSRTGLRVTLERRPAKALLDRMTYFREIRLNGTARIVPLQTLLEATGTANYSPPDNLSLLPAQSPVLKRQSTRYSAHGLHEYKGKFHPHIVRAIGNLLSLPAGAWVLDPFCGSGTSLLECLHAGWNAIGVDRNPLGVLISNTKLEAMRVRLEVLQEQIGAACRHLQNISRGLCFDRPFSASDYKSLHGRTGFTLPNRAYLEEWFSPSVLAQLSLIAETITRMEDQSVRNIARLVLSDALRAVSLQDPGDLRIRRRKDARDNYPAIPLFLRNLTTRIETIVRARRVLGVVSGTQMAWLGDSRRGLPQGTPRPTNGAQQFDCIITSPPYATALPYIDTQRLSLTFLGLIDHAEIRDVERSLIGNREISQRERTVDEEAIDTNGGHLPEEVLALCRKARSLLASEDGFRRRNMPALLFRYFIDMAKAFSSLLPLVRPNGTLALLVGPNRTILGGQELRIETPDLLACVAEHVGWKRSEVIPLDAYRRFDIHQRNSITREVLVILRRHGGRPTSRPVRLARHSQRNYGQGGTTPAVTGPQERFVSIGLRRALVGGSVTNVMRHSGTVG